MIESLHDEKDRRIKLEEDLYEVTLRSRKFE